MFDKTVVQIANWLYDQHIQDEEIFGVIAKCNRKVAVTKLCHELQALKANDDSEDSLFEYIWEEYCRQNEGGE